LAGVELEKALLIWPNLPDIHLVKTGVGERAHAADVVLRIGAARRRDHVLTDELGKLAEVPGRRQKLHCLARDLFRWPQPVHEPARLPGIRPPAHFESALDDPVATAGLSVEPDEVSVGLDTHVAVSHLGRELDRLLAESRHEDRRRLVRE